jgi:hypothetical protein
VSAGRQNGLQAQNEGKDVRLKQPKIASASEILHSQRQTAKRTGVFPQPVKPVPFTLLNFSAACSAPAKLKTAKYLHMRLFSACSVVPNKGQMTAFACPPRDRPSGDFHSWNMLLGLFAYAEVVRLRLPDLFRDD